MPKHRATVSGSHGTITIDNSTGNVLSFTDAYSKEAHEYKQQGITRFDLLEHYLFWNGRDGKRYQRVDQYDILDLGYWWEKDGVKGYAKPESDYRRECEIAKPSLYPDGDLGRILGKLLSSGAQFAFSYTPFKYDGEGAVNSQNPNVTLWSEDDEHWHKVDDFHPLWLYDMKQVIDASIRELEVMGILQKGESGMTNRQGRWQTRYGQWVVLCSGGCGDVTVRPSVTKMQSWTCGRCLKPRLGRKDE